MLLPSVSIEKYYTVPPPIPFAHSTIGRYLMAHTVVGLHQQTNNAKKKLK